MTAGRIRVVSAPRSTRACPRVARNLGRSATGADISQSGRFSRDRSNLVEFLREDLTHLFDDQGIDVSKYDERVFFTDPITRYDTIQGYVKNIKFLKNIFRPKFTLHEIEQTGDDEITFRWTMDMVLAMAGIRRELVFTGTSRLGVNPVTDRFCSHIDTWDSISDSAQEYFSVEAFLHMLGQLFSQRSEPGEVLVKRKEYEILRQPDGHTAAVFIPLHVDKNTGVKKLEQDGLQVKEVTGHSPRLHFILQSFRFPPFPIPETTIS
jgi:hypothetical protein